MLAAANLIPKNVGFSTEKLDGGFELRTDQPGDPHPGNSNAGHEFGITRSKGLIGPEFSDEDRWAIVGYLKQL
jgi:hypothetical protein